MTTRGRYSGRPRQPENEAQIRIIGPLHVVNELREALAAAVETMPGWQMARTSALMPADQPTHVRRYVHVKAEAARPRAGRYRYPAGEEVRDA